MKIQCRANAILFETRQSTHATGERKITNYKTVPGKGWNVHLRLYSPVQSWFDETWRTGEFELVK